MHRCRSGSRRARGRLDEGEPAARRRPVGAGRRLRDGGRRRSIRPVLAGDGRQGCVVVDAVPVIKVSRTKPLRRNSPKERTRPRPRAGRWWVRRKNIRGTVPPWQGLALREGLLRAHEAGLPEVQRLAAARRREAVPLRFSGPGSAESRRSGFFDEHGDGISHAGIATGKGTAVHASEYVNKVTETRIQYIRFYNRGYQSARRLL